jgi:hypothetical protein
LIGCLGEGFCQTLPFWGCRWLKETFYFFFENSLPIVFRFIGPRTNERKGYLTIVGL